jgi:F0F1-type ATP synthase assembly protein I
MKLLPKDTRVRNDDSLGLGIEVAVVLVLFFLAGWGLDRLLGTAPWLMIAGTLLGAVGLFVTFRYRYEARMAAHERDRAARRGPTR